MTSGIEKSPAGQDHVASRPLRQKGRHATDILVQSLLAALPDCFEPPGKHPLLGGHRFECPYIFGPWRTSEEGFGRSPRDQSLRYREFDFYAITRESNQRKAPSTPIGSLHGFQITIPRCPTETDFMEEMDGESAELGALGGLVASEWGGAPDILSTTGASLIYLLYQHSYARSGALKTGQLFEAFCSENLKKGGVVFVHLLPDEYTPLNSAMWELRREIEASGDDTRRLDEAVEQYGRLRHSMRVRMRAAARLLANRFGMRQTRAAADDAPFAYAVCGPHRVRRALQAQLDEARHDDEAPVTGPFSEAPDVVRQNMGVPTIELARGALPRTRKGTGSVM